MNTQKIKSKLVISCYFSFDNFKTNHKIKKLIKERLELQAPYINRWNEAMAIGAYPSNCSETSSILWQYSDDCWYLSGDRSNDMNFYTKRSLFLYCYMSTELFMLTDKSS